MTIYYPTSKVGGDANRVGGGVNSVGCTWLIPSVKLETADFLYGPTLPKNARVVGVTLTATDCDGSGTPALTLDVGDTDDDNRLVAASTIGQAGGVTSTMAAAGMIWKTTAPTRIDVTAAAAAGASASTTQLISLMINYIVEEEAS